MSAVAFLAGWIGVALLVTALSLALLALWPNEWGRPTRRGMMFISAILLVAFVKHREHNRPSDW